MEVKNMIFKKQKRTDFTNSRIASLDMLETYYLENTNFELTQFCRFKTGQRKN